MIRENKEVPGYLAVSEHPSIYPFICTLCDDYVTPAIYLGRDVLLPNEPGRTRQPINHPVGRLFLIS